MYLPDSPLHIVSILCHVWQQLIATGHSLARQSHSCLRLCCTVSVSTKSISIAFLAAPRAIELTDDEFCLPYLSLVYTWFNIHATRASILILYLKKHECESAIR